jgi:hypothetical protein
MVPVPTFEKVMVPVPVPTLESYGSGSGYSSHKSKFVKKFFCKYFAFLHSKLFD